MLFRTRPNREELNATKVPTSWDIAWAAGIYEGEGSCRLCGRGKRSLAAAVVQKDPELLYRLRDWFGGSINGNGKNQGIHVWDICGDRARIFLSQIYGYMTARRKAQIDATNCLDFLGDISPVGLSVEELNVHLLAHYQNHIDTTWKNPKVSKTKRRKKYEEQSSDPEWRQKTNDSNKRSRARMTEEQKENARKYQQDYYQKKKQREAIHVVEIDKSA